MAKLKKLIEPKSGMEIAHENFKKDAEAAGIDTSKLDENLEAALDEITEEDPEAYKQALKDTIKRFFLNKTEYDSYKKLVDADNAGIKEIMMEHNLKEFEVDGIVAKCSIQERESFNEEMLLQIVKKSKVKGIVKKKEYVDADALESAIYNGEFDAAILEPAREIKQVVTLKVARKKKEKK